MLNHFLHAGFLNGRSSVRSLDTHISFHWEDAWNQKLAFRTLEIWPCDLFSHTVKSLHLLSQKLKKKKIPDSCVQHKYMLHLPCYLFPNPSGREKDWKRKQEREGEKARLEAFLVSALCALAWLGPSYASVPQRDSALHRQTNTHTHSQLGLPVIRQQEERAKYTLSPNHAFINTFTHPKLFLQQHVTEWHGDERLDSLKTAWKRKAQRLQIQACNELHGLFLSKYYWICIFFSSKIDFQNILFDTKLNTKC